MYYRSRRNPLARILCIATRKREMDVKGNPPVVIPLRGFFALQRCAHLLPCCRFNVVIPLRGFFSFQLATFGQPNIVAAQE